MAATSGEPLRRVVVEVFGTASASTFTDDNGHFSFPDVRPGMVNLVARKPGYFCQPEQGMSIDTRVAGAVTISMIPSGGMSGVVMGPDNQALERVPVRIFESTILEGRRRWSPHAAKVTDEEGRFRVGDLKPGVYQLAVGPALSRDISQHATGYPLTFYPGVPDRESASLVQILPGQEAELNLKLHKVRFYQVAGKVNGVTGRGVNVQFLDAANNPVFAPMRGDYEAGDFEALVAAGKYTIRAQSIDDRGKMSRAKASLTVHADVSGFAMTLHPGITIPVTIRKELAKSAAAQMGGVAGASVRLISTKDENDIAFSRNEGGAENLAISIPNVEPGTYEVQVTPEVWGGPMYVASAKSGGKDLFRELLTIEPDGTVDPIEIVIKDDGAVLEGAVRSGAAGSGQVVIVSDTNPGRRVVANYGTDGRVYAPALAPGAYAIYPFAHADNVEFTNPDALRRYAAKAVHVVLSPKQSSHITMDAIETEQ